jgi:hypothetical protein
MNELEDSWIQDEANGYTYNNIYFLAEAAAGR